jgi:hypothetical protein
MKILPKNLVIFLLLSLFSSAKARSITYSEPLLFSSYSASIPYSDTLPEIAFTALEESAIQYKFENNFDYQIADFNRRILPGRKIFILPQTININNNLKENYLLQIIKSSQRLAERNIKL